MERKTKSIQTLLFAREMRHRSMTSDFRTARAAKTRELEGTSGSFGTTNSLDKRLKVARKMNKTSNSNRMN
jgi:hypothetical protein